MQYLWVNEWHMYGSSRMGVYQAQQDTVQGVVRSYNHRVSNDTTSGNYFAIDTLNYNQFVKGKIHHLYKGRRSYEGTNHLGNVLVVFTDKRINVCVNDTISYYRADVVNAYDYTPFGAPMPTRTWHGDTTEKYRFGFNGQEKDDEVSGDGNSNTAEYWQYDTRLGRRWNVDPIYKSNLSNYSVLSGNPIYRVDPKGDNDDGYTVDEYGNITKVDDTGGDKYDVLYEKSEYDKGNKSYDYKGTGNTGIRIDDKSFLPSIAKKQDITQTDPFDNKTIHHVYYSIIKSNNALDVFTFLADATSNDQNRNRGIEWGYMKLKNGTTAIGTVKNGDQSVIWTNIPGFTNKSEHAVSIHSHPGKSYDAFLVNGTDISIAESTRKQNPNAEFFVYMPELTMENWNEVMKKKVGFKKINYQPNKFFKY